LTQNRKRVQQEVMSLPPLSSFFFPLSLVRLLASLGTPCSVLTKEKEERRKRKTPAVTSLPVAPDGSPAPPAQAVFFRFSESPIDRLTRGNAPAGA
jgi:hypothetical protein